MADPEQSPIDQDVVEQLPKRGIKQVASRITHGLMSRLKSRNISPRQAMGEIAQSGPALEEVDKNPEVAVDEIDSLKDQKLTEPRFPISPNRLYYHLVQEAEENYQAEDSFKNLEARAKQSNYKAYEHYFEQRKFGTRDKLRHQALLAEAKLRGVKNPDEFRKLVEFFDSLHTKSEYGRGKTYKEILSEEQKEQIREEWKRKDPRYEIDFSSYEGKTSYSVRRRVPADVERKNIPMLVKLANSSTSANESIKYLYSKNVYLGFNLDSSETVNQISDFLALPNAAVVIEKLKSLDMLDLGSHMKNGQVIGSLEGLMALAQNSERIDSLDQDTLHKINIMSKSLRKDFSPADLDDYLDVIKDPLKFDLFTSLRAHYLIPEAKNEQIPIFETINALAQSDLSANLLKLAKLGIRPNTEIIKSYDNYDSGVIAKKDQDIETMLVNLRQEMSDGVMQKLLSDPEQQAYVKVVTQLDAKPFLRSTQLEKLMETYDIKERLIHLTLMLKQSGAPDVYHGDSQFQNLSEMSEKIIRRNPEVGDVLSSDGFGDFLNTLQEKLGYQPSIKDFYDYRYKYIGYGGRSYQEGSVLIDLYNREDLRNGLNDPKIIESLTKIIYKGDIDITNLTHLLNFSVHPDSVNIVNFALDQKIIVENNITDQDLARLYKLIEIQDRTGKPIAEFTKYARDLNLISQTQLEENDLIIIDLLANTPLEKVKLFEDLLPKVKDYQEYFTNSDVLKLINQNISQEQLLVLMDATRIIPDFQSKGVMDYFRRFPHRLLSESGVQFVANIGGKIQDKKQVEMVINSVGGGFLSTSNAELIVDQGKALFAPKMEGIAKLVLEQGKLLVRDASDVKFIVGLVGRFGAKSADVIRSYRDCLDAKVITHEDKPLVAEFVEQFRIPTPEIITRYKEAKRSGTEQVFLIELKGLASKVTGGGGVTDDERAKPYFKDLLRCVFPNNVGSWTSYESNNSCQDRSADLADFKIRSNYQIDLLTVGDISLKEGVSLDKPNIDRLTNNILTVAKRFEGLGYDSVKMQADVVSQIETNLKKLAETGALKGISLESLTNVDDKFFLLMTAATYGNDVIAKADLKDLMISYEFAYFEDVRNYIQGTTDRVSKAGNADYALLCELDGFYTDRVKEVSRRMVQAGWKNQALADKMPEFFQDLVEENQNQRRTDTINRFQIDKLGMTDGFVKQLTRQFKERTGRDYSPEQVKAILTRYESMTQGLVEPRQLDKERVELLKNGSKKKTREEITQAIYGQFKSQRDKTIVAATAISGEAIDPKEMHLGEINLQQMLEVQADVVGGVYDAEQFAGFTGQRFVDLFVDERQVLENELDKFVSASGGERTVLNAYITKSKESANARMVGGVCVSGDNPSKNPDKNIWDMENYMQLVLQDPDSYQSQGLALLHHFEENGQKVLAASLNPSSTYLYSVDEEAMFNGMLSALERFSTDNNFDRIVVSQNRGIRTNRTGGQFEGAIDKRISQIGERMSFGERKVFSYSPPYELQDMDVVWNKPVATAV